MLFKPCIVVVWVATLVFMVHTTKSRPYSLGQKWKRASGCMLRNTQLCQQAKVEHVKTPGLLEPLHVLHQPWTTVSLNFIEGLPLSNKCDVILMVVDKFAKYGHFIPLSHPLTISLHFKWRKLIWTTSTSFTVCLSRWSLTGIKISQVLCGNNCSNSLTPGFWWAPLIIPKQMDRPNDLITWKHF